MGYRHEATDPAIWAGGNFFQPVPSLFSLSQASSPPSNAQDFSASQHPDDIGLKEALHQLPVELSPSGDREQSLGAAQMVLTLSNPNPETIMRILEVLASAGCQANISINCN